MGRVDKKIAIVTGGGNGIGRAIAERLAEEGAIVTVTDQNPEAGKAVADGVDTMQFLEHDVRIAADWAKVMASVTRQHGRLDLLINNAGILATESSQDVESTSLDQWRTVNAVNSEGVFLGCQQGIEAMKATGGSIVNLSSIAALMATPHLSAYGASKAAVRQLTKTVAVHCGRKGYRIRCNSVHPGVIQTSMGDHVMALGGGNVEQKWAARIAAIPLGEAGTVHDVASCVLFLASDEARHITVAELVVDGGMTIC